MKHQDSEKLIFCYNFMNEEGKQVGKRASRGDTLCKSIVACYVQTVHTKDEYYINELYEKIQKYKQEMNK